MFNEGSRPLVFVGSHRSGTSAVTERMRALGLFVGSRLDSHAESTFFQRINRSLTAEAGGHWTTPEVVATAINGIDDLESFVAPVRTLLDGPAAAEFWGSAAARRRRPTTWGWKDPRNTYLLPIWKVMFPGLRVVSIRRDPRACALSLNQRAVQICVENAERASASRSSRFRRGLRSQRRWLRGRPILADGWRTLDLSGAVDVALEYREIQNRLIAGSDVLTIDYEHLVAEPADVLRETADFCELRVSASALETQAASIVGSDNSDRVDALVLTDTQQRRLSELGGEERTERASESN